MRRKCEGIHIFGEVSLGYPALIEIAIILLAALLSFKTTDSEDPEENHFTWSAIREVAVLFVEFLSQCSRLSCF